LKTILKLLQLQVKGSSRIGSSSGNKDWDREDSGFLSFVNMALLSK